MAGLGSGDDVSRFAVPLVMGTAVLLSTLVMQPWVRRQQAAELRRILVMDAA